MLRGSIAEHGERLPDVERVAAAARRQRYALADALQEVEAEIAATLAPLALLLGLAYAAARLAGVRLPGPRRPSA